MNNKEQRIAIIGGGPSGLFIYKRLLESKQKNITIDIFERKGYLGAGMPYSAEGANEEHITNVSDNEIPVIFNSIEDWVKVAPQTILDKFGINPDNFNEYKVLPRLFFGEFLSAQFDFLKDLSEENGVKTTVHLNCPVDDIVDHPKKEKVSVVSKYLGTLSFDRVIICSGHNWPKKYEGKIPGYFDSPYPPKKLMLKLDRPVGIMGSSLTAIDAVRTLAKLNGTFVEGKNGKLQFKLNKESKGFKLVLHSRNGLLPAIRFHLKDSHLGKDKTLSKQEIKEHIKDNNGFIALDFVFERNFKEMFIENDPKFYEQIKDMDLEAFVDAMMDFREKKDPFELFKLEYEEAEKSIERERSIYWKEALAILSFAMNYPAKYLSAEDMERLQKVLMPLISIVIAFVPQSSCRVLMALHEAGILDIVAVGNDSKVEPVKSGGAIYHYKNEQNEAINVFFETFVDCIGQPHLSFKDFPFKRLTKSGTISPAQLRFESAKKGQEELNEGNELVTHNNGEYFLNVPGITINDDFQVVDNKGKANERVYIMAVPYIGGYNPDYSGIDFCEAASKTVAESIVKGLQSNNY